MASFLTCIVVTESSLWNPWLSFVIFLYVALCSVLGIGRVQEKLVAPSHGKPTNKRNAHLCVRTTASRRHRASKGAFRREAMAGTAGIQELGRHPYDGAIHGKVSADLCQALVPALHSLTPDPHCEKSVFSDPNPEILGA